MGGRCVCNPGYTGKRCELYIGKKYKPNHIFTAFSLISDFLTEEQKRDIFFNNAVRFLRLDEAEIIK